jgi:Ran GTPase-activating protein (RanGAP) involved in mRNA processing and transport
MGALSVLNLAANNLGELVPPEGWSIKDEGSYRQKYIHIDGREQKEDPGSKPEGVIAIANAIPDMGALSVLSLKKNSLSNKEAGKALAQALAGNTTLRELDVSDNQSPTGDFSARDGPGFAHELAVGIRDNGTLTSLNLSSNDLRVEGAKIVAEAIKVTNCALAVVSAVSCPSDRLLNCCCLLLSTQDNGALSIANVMGNHIGKEMLSKLQEIMRSKPELVSLCGIADDATEADLSGLGMDADDAIVLASELPDKGVLIKFDISRNCIGAAQEGELRHICLASNIELAK